MRDDLSVTANDQASLEALRSWRRGARQTMARLRRERYQVIDEAIADGHSATEIADALGISRQALAAFLNRRDGQ